MADRPPLSERIAKNLADAQAKAAARSHQTKRRRERRKRAKAREAQNITAATREEDHQ